MGQLVVVFQESLREIGAYYVQGDMVFAVFWAMVV